MFRVDRQVTSDVEDAHEPKFTQSDAQVRATMSEMAKFLLAEAPQAHDTAAREHLLEELINRFGSQGLSMTLMKQESSAHRSDISLGGGASATTDTKSGGRFGLSVTGAMEKGWSTQVKEKDSTGSYRINNVRSGWFERNKASVDLTANANVKTVGLPSTPLVSAGASFGESGGSVRVRTPTREGNFVPEKTFSDTETPDKNFFKEIVRGSHIAAVEGEREFIFDTIGWANLRQRERENPPTFLDA